MSDIHSSQIRRSPHHIVKNTVFQDAKGLTSQFEDLDCRPAEDSNSPTGTSHVFQIETSGMRSSSLILMDAAVRMIDKDAYVEFDADDDKINIVLPTTRTRVPVQEMKRHISTLRHALLDLVTQEPDGHYSLHTSKALQTLDIPAFLQALTYDYARYHDIVSFDETNGHSVMDWEKLDPVLKPKYACYYAVPDPSGASEGQMLDDTRFQQLNHYSEQVGEPTHDPETAFHHATMNDAAMTMLSSAIGIRSSRATQH